MHLILAIIETFNNIYCNDIWKDASDNDDFYLRWNKIFNYDNYVDNKKIYKNKLVITLNKIT